MDIDIKNILITEQTDVLKVGGLSYMFSFCSVFKLMCLQQYKSFFFSMYLAHISPLGRIHSHSLNSMIDDKNINRLFLTHIKMII
jgi:hypothetical protein